MVANTFRKSRKGSGITDYQNIFLGDIPNSWEKKIADVKLNIYKKHWTVCGLKPTRAFFFPIFLKNCGTASLKKTSIESKHSYV